MLPGGDSGAVAYCKVYDIGVAAVFRELFAHSMHLCVQDSSSETVRAPQGNRRRDLLSWLVFPVRCARSAHSVLPSPAKHGTCDIDNSSVPSVS